MNKCMVAQMVKHVHYTLSTVTNTMTVCVEEKSEWAFLTLSVAAAKQNIENKAERTRMAFCGVDIRESSYVV